MRIDINKFVDTIYSQINTVDGTLYSGTDHWISAPYDMIAPINAITGQSFKTRDDIILSNIRWDYGFESSGWITEEQLHQNKYTISPKGFPVYLSSKRVVYNVDHVVELTYHNQASEIVYNIDTERLTNIERWINRLQCNVLHDGCDPAYVMEIDKIHIPYWNQFRNRETYYHTLFHEIAHWTGHKKRLNRKGIAGGVDTDSERYKKEEIVAELASVMLCLKFNIKVGYKTSLSYIQGYATDEMKTKKSIRKFTMQAYEIVLYLESIAD